MIRLRAAGCRPYLVCIDCILLVAGFIIFLLPKKTFAFLELLNIVGADIIRPPIWATTRVSANKQKKSSQSKGTLFVIFIRC